MTVQTVDFPGIELVRAGTWNSRLGSAEITPEDLAAAVEAYSDPDVDHGKLKWGHSSSLNEELGDGAPSFGWIENLRLSDDKRSLFGDIVDVPRKLAGLIGRAYRQRSVEMRRNVTTPSGKTYKAALTGLALLGAAPPAVKGMEDIAALYASENPSGIDDEASHESIVSVELSGDSLIPRYEQGATDNSGEAPGPGGVTDEQEEPGMAYPKSTLDALGLPEDATEEQVNAVLAERLVAEPEQNPEAVEKSAEEAAEAEAEKPAEEKPDVNLSALAAEYREQIVALSAQVEELRADQHQRQVREVIDVALSEGRFGPAKGDELVTKFGANIDQLRDVIDTAFPKGTVNLSEAGSDIALSAKAETPELDAYLDRLGL